MLQTAWFYTRTNYQLCRWKGKELLITAWHLQILECCGSGFWNQCNPTTNLCSYILCISCTLSLETNTCFHSFEQSLNHIIILWFYLVYTPGLNKAVFYNISPTWQATCKVFRKLRGILCLRLCFCVHYPGESPGQVATLAHGIKWCTRPLDTSKCMVLHQDQLPTLPMERERAFNYSFCKYWTVAALASETNAILPPISAHISFAYYLVLDLVRL